MNLKIGIICARFNELITKSLLQGAIDVLTNMGLMRVELLPTGYQGHLKFPLLQKQCSLNTMPLLQLHVLLEATRLTLTMFVMPLHKE